MNRRLYSVSSRAARSGSSHTHSPKRSCSASAFSTAAAVSTGFTTRLPSTVSSVTWIGRCSSVDLAIAGAGIRRVPHSLVAATDVLLPRTPHTAPPGCSTASDWSRRISRRNSWWVAASIHAAPRRACTSSIPRSSGTAASSAVTLTASSGRRIAASRAASSFSRTLPDRYSAAGTSRSSVGSSYTSSPSAARASSGSVPSRSAMCARSTRPSASRLTASASSAVSTPSTGVRATSVRCESIVAGTAVCVASSKLSRALISGANGSERRVSITAGRRRPIRGSPVSESRRPVG